MQKDIINSLTENFEAHAQQTDNGIEYWLARDLQYLLGYTKWDNFLNVVSKAKTACEISDHDVVDHFANVGKMVDLGSGSQREVDDSCPLLKMSKRSNIDLLRMRRSLLKIPIFSTIDR